MKLIKILKFSSVTADASVDTIDRSAATADTTTKCEAKVSTTDPKTALKVGYDVDRGRCLTRST